MGSDKPSGAPGRPPGAGGNPDLSGYSGRDAAIARGDGERLRAGEVSPNGQKRLVKGRKGDAGAAAPVPWDETVGDWLTYLQGGHKPSTVKDYRSRIGLVRAWAEAQGLDVGGFKAKHLDRYLSERQAAGLKDTSRRHDAIVAKTFLKWAFLRKYIKSDPLYGYAIPKAQTAARYVPTADEIGRLIQAVDDCWNVHKSPEARYVYDRARHFYAARDTAIIVGLVATGARISEMFGLRLEDWRPDENQITFRETKGGGAAHLPISALWIPYVDAYLRLRPHSDNPYLFVTADGGSYDAKGRYRPLPPTTWARAWSRYMKQAGLEGWSRHNLRHYHATHIAVHQKDLMLASAMLRHKDLKTTKIYTHNSAQQVQEAFATADPLKSIPILVNKRSTKGKPKLL